MSLSLIIHIVLHGKIQRAIHSYRLNCTKKLNKVVYLNSWRLFLNCRDFAVSIGCKVMDAGYVREGFTYSLNFIVIWNSHDTHIQEIYENWAVLKMYWFYNIILKIIDKFIFKEFKQHTNLDILPALPCRSSTGITWKALGM